MQLATLFTREGELTGEHIMCRPVRRRSPRRALEAIALVATATGWGRLMRDPVPREFIGEAPALGLKN